MKAVQLITVALFIGASHTISAQQKMITLDHGEAPASIEALVHATSLVAVVRIDKTDQVVTGTADHKLPQAKHTATLIEIIRGGMPVNAVISVLQPGGAARIGGVDTYVDDRDFPVLRPGATALLFLNYSSEFKAYTVASGPAGVFRSFGGDSLFVPAAARLAGQLTARSTISLTDLRSLVKAVPNVK